MDCLRPILLPKQGYVPCGKCLACLQRRQSDWVVRLREELKCSSSCYFLTLTYSEDNVPREMIDGKEWKVLCKKDFQNWMKRFRKAISPDLIRFFACGEYGSKTLRPHYHAIIFNFPANKDILEVLQNTWRLGFVMASVVKPAHFPYVAKYCSMYSDLPLVLRSKLYRPFILCSRNPAIGRNFLSDVIFTYYRETLSTVIRHRDGTKSALPRYYADRIFDDQMKFDIRQSKDEYRSLKDCEYFQKWSHTHDPLATPYRDQVREDYLRSYKKRLFKSKPDSL